MNTETKHTPGKWNAHEAKSGWIVEAPGSRPFSTVTICSVYETALTTDQPERAPIDSALIASAPDMAKEIAQLKADKQVLRSMILTLLDAVDYTAGNCSQIQPVGEVLDRVLIKEARNLIAKHS